MNKQLTVNVSFTWESMMPWLVEVASHGATEEGRNKAMSELMRLARAADQIAAEQKEATTNG